MNSYIKSPLNYVGGKYKLLNEIIPLFPNDINTFVDLFGGGLNVGINVNANKILYNDIESHVVELMKYLKNTEIQKLLMEIDGLIEKYNLSKENAEGFLKLREYYNESNNNPIVFYTMLCFAFNYQIRFNQNGKYNMPFGKNRSSFNPALRQTFIAFVNALHNKNIVFENMDFIQYNFDQLNSGDFVYCDPPYFNSVAAYNENGGWTENHEVKLLDILTVLDRNGIKFALSNNLKYENQILNKWITNYNVHYLNGNYSNCNYHKIDRSKDVEVLITNY